MQRGLSELTNVVHIAAVFCKIGQFLLSRSVFLCQNVTDGRAKRDLSAVRGVLAQTGGVRPPQRSRCAIALTLAEREEISRSVAEGQSIRLIAAQLGRAPPTVSREIRRNGSQADYRATEQTMLSGIVRFVPSAAN